MNAMSEHESGPSDEGGRLAPAESLPHADLASQADVSHEATGPVLLPTPIVSLAAEQSPTIAQLQERLDRLEKSLAPLHQLEGLEERLFQHVTTHIERTQPEPPPTSTQIAEPSILAKASALGAVGRQVLTSMVMPAITQPTSSSTGRPPTRPWAIREILAELQAMFYMYVDPRYRLSWPGRILPAVFLGLFLTTGWWAPYFLCGIGEILRKPIEIVLCFGLIKLLSYEARRYRETAPDLPPSLRL